MNADGSEPVQLTFTTDISEFAPYWSPGGKRLAFMRRRGKEVLPRIYVINADGSEEKLLTSNLAFAPAWSPDGTRIAFAQFKQFPDICVVNVDGSGLTRLTNIPARDWTPSWRPVEAPVEIDRE